MKYPTIISLWILLEYMTSATAQRDDSCQDERGSYCRRLGQKQLLSRCYTRESRCCATCRRLRLDIPGCPYGDRASWCSSVGYDRPISDCYTHNVTCCQTCSLYHSGNKECPYGDQLNWCSEIGSRYLVSSCYEKEQSCCDTCGRFKKPIPGCEYGDHENWCPWIAPSYCETDPHVCCATCSVLSPTTTTTTTPTTTTPTTTTIHDVRATPKMVSSKSGAEVDNIVTYTGSPGRPDDGVGVVTSQHVTGSETTVIHSGEHSSTRTPPVVSPDLNSVPGGGRGDPDDDVSLDILCFNNHTRHKLRHDKHGGRHRSRGHVSLDIICRNVTLNSNSFISFNNSKQEDLTVRFSLNTSKTSSYYEDGDYNNSLTTSSPSGTGFHGDKEFQEGHGLVFSISPSRHRITKIHILLGIFILIFLIDE